MSNDFKFSVVEELPKKTGCPDLLPETIKLMDALNENKGKIVKLDFGSRKEMLTAYYRIRNLRESKRVNYFGVRRIGSSLFVDLKGGGENGRTVEKA